MMISIFGPLEPSGWGKICWDSTQNWFPHTSWPKLPSWVGCLYPQKNLSWLSVQLWQRVYLINLLVLGIDLENLMDPHGVTPVENGGSSESSPEGSPLPPPPNTPIKTEFPMNSTGSSSISESSTTPPITLLAAGPSWHSTSQDLPDEGKWIKKRGLVSNYTISLSHTYERKRSWIFLTWIYNFLRWCYYLILTGASQFFWGLPVELLPHSSYHSE